MDTAPNFSKILHYWRAGIFYPVGRGHGPDLIEIKNLFDMGKPSIKFASLQPFKGNLLMKRRNNYK